MTKSQSLYYIATVIIITLLAYVYTTVVHAPDNTNEPDINKTTNEDVSKQVQETPNDSEIAPIPEDTSSINSSASLSGTAWRWEYTETTDKGPLLKPKQADSFILSFYADGKMGSKTDCNSVGGEYQATDQSLNFGELMSTLMFCENSDESVYTTQLSQVESFTQNTETLKLNLKNDAGVMVFKKVAQ